MFGSFSIGRLFGIQVRVHWMFIALVVLLAASVEGQLWWHTVLQVLVGFGCVLLHELGHSLVARRFGIRVYDITLWPLGGIARMDQIPESPKVESLVAIAGPAVNFVLVALAAAVLAALGVLQLSIPALADALAGADWLASAAVAFVAYNLLLGTFNLVPAFPMDGGRVLRAVLGAFRDWVRATEIAVAVGRVVAFLMFTAGVVLTFQFGLGGGPISLMLIALFVGWAGTRELWAVRLRHGRFPFGDLASGRFPGSFGGLRFDLRDAGARRDAESRPAQGESPPGSEGSARNLHVDPETGARRPVADWKGDGFGRERIDDDAVARLERFHGRLGEREL